MPPLVSCFRAPVKVFRGRKASHRGRVGGKNDNGEWLHSPHSCPKPPSHWVLSTEIPPRRGIPGQYPIQREWNVSLCWHAVVHIDLKMLGMLFCAGPHTIVCLFNTSPHYVMYFNCIFPQQVPNIALRCAFVSVTLKLFMEKLMAPTDFVCNFTMSHPIWCVLCFTYRPNCLNCIFS